MSCEVASEVRIKVIALTVSHSDLWKLSRGGLGRIEWLYL